MCYDFYSCPFEPDTCYPGCGLHLECYSCSWYKVVAPGTESNNNYKGSNGNNGYNDTNGSHNTAMVPR